MRRNYHCGRFVRQPFSRREMLLRCASGFGAVALASLFGENLLTGAVASESTGHGPLAPRAPHFPAKAKNIIFLYMDGGPSQVDTFDPKPRLQKEHGQPFKMRMEPTQFNNNGNTLGCPWSFANHGQSGIPISSLFPHLAENADELCVIRSMTSNFSEH